MKYEVQKSIQNKRNQLKKEIKREVTKEREETELEKIKQIENSKNDS